MESRLDADMMKFTNTEAEDLDLELSEDGGGSVASSADINFDINNFDETPGLDFGWMDSNVGSLDFERMNMGGFDPTDMHQFGMNPELNGPADMSEMNGTAGMAGTPGMAGVQGMPNMSNDFTRQPGMPQLSPNPNTRLDPRLDSTLNTSAEPVHTDEATKKSGFVQRMESATMTRAQGLLQHLTFGAPEEMQPIKLPPHSDILDVADQVHNDKLPYTVRLESFPLRSRVETQIKCRLVIQDKQTGMPTSQSLLHLPTDTIARPRFQLINPEVLAQDPKIDAATLYLSVDAINPDEMSEQILMCAKCLERERRRAFRKKAMDPHEETYWTGVQNRRIIVFNCRQVMPISASGQVELPLRVACYCRHHAAKNGYQLLFGVRDRQGNLLGRTVSPRVFITDSHKDSRRNEEAAFDHSGEQNMSEASDVSADVSGGFTPSSVDSAVESEGELEAGSMHSRSSSSVHRVGSNTSINRSHPYARPQSKPHVPSVHLARQIQQSQAVPFWLAGVQTDSRPPSGQQTPQHPQQQQQQIPQQPTAFGQQPWRGSSSLARVSRVIPPSGSMRGGVEITLLGQGFRPGAVAMFGDLPSISTQFWSDSTIIAHLPPSSQPGPVPVTFKDDDETVKNSAPVFTYINDGEDKLKELTLQMIGYKMGGNMDDISGIVERMGAETHMDNGGSNGMGSSNGAMSNGRSSMGGMSHSRNHQTKATLSGEKMALWTLANISKIPSAQPLNVNLRNDEGQSMVHLAAMLGYASVVKALMAKNAYVDLQDVSGYTPLHFAVLFDNRNVTRLLLQADADPFNRTSHGLTARDLADGTVVDLLPKDQRSWYSELNRRGSSSSLNSLGEIDGLGEVIEETPFLSPLSDHDVAPRKPPSYSQLYPERIITNRASKQLRSERTRASTMRSSVIEIEVSEDELEAENEGEADIEDEGEEEEGSRIPELRIEEVQIEDEPVDEDDPEEDEMLARPRPAWVERWASRDLDIRNDRMLFTFWIPLSLITIIGILSIYTLQNYGTPGAPAWVTKFGDAVGNVISQIMDRVMPIPRPAASAPTWR